MAYCVVSSIEQVPHNVSTQQVNNKTQNQTPIKKLPASVRSVSNEFFLSGNHINRSNVNTLFNRGIIYELRTERAYVLCVCLSPHGNQTDNLCNGR